ncbi:MAG TPA: class I SAM-dependent methyltransferase [Puia sp.]|nr:class I SAM-dependent methyltransferase [Puia sp.]
MNEGEHLKEELFCLKYELDALANITLYGKAERWVPSFTGLTKDEDHIGRYKLAVGYVAGRKVLDIACGAGKGSQLLSLEGHANEVLGADVDADSVRYAQHRYGGKNVSFQQMDGTNLIFDQEFDVVVSFETIEHIKSVDVFLKNIWNALKPGGIFVVSTPISKLDLDTKPLNPYHVQEWGFNAFHDVLKGAGFSIEKVFTQVDLRLNGPSIFQRIKKRLLNKKKNIHHYTGYEEKRIEEFRNQFSIDEFGTIRNGFQILICKKILLS